MSRKSAAGICVAPVFASLDSSIAVPLRRLLRNSSRSVNPSIDAFLKKMIPFFRKKSWTGGAVLWVDVGSRSAKSDRSLLDSGQRRQPGGWGKRDRGGGILVFVIVGGEVPCSWIVLVDV